MITTVMAPQIRWPAVMLHLSRPKPGSSESESEIEKGTSNQLAARSTTLAAPLEPTLSKVFSGTKQHCAKTRVSFTNEIH